MCEFVEAYKSSEAAFSGESISALMELESSYFKESERANGCLSAVRQILIEKRKEAYGGKICQVQHKDGRSWVGVFDRMFAEVFSFYTEEGTSIIQEWKNVIVNVK